MMIFFIGCGAAPQIINKEYKYEKMVFGTHNFTFEIHLENIGNSGRIHNLINRLIYDNRNFDEYMEYTEKNFMENINEADYPPMIDEDGAEYFYHSYLGKEYSIIFNNDTHVIFEYKLYFYNSGTAHGYYWIEYFIIDFKEEKILDINDLIYPIPEDLLQRYLESNNDIGYYLWARNIWPPDTVNFCNENIELIWNIYTITPYSAGIIYIEIQDEIIEQYLTDKGKALVRIIANERR
jgi:hypothetical protein